MIYLRYILILSLISLSGCVSGHVAPGLDVYEVLKPSSEIVKARVGRDDILEIYTYDGVKHVVVVDSISDEAIHGKCLNQLPCSVEFSKIDYLILTTDRHVHMLHVCPGSPLCYP